MSLIEKIRKAVEKCHLMEPFTTQDVKCWVKKHCIVKDDGEEYADASISAILPNSDVENEPTANRNIRVLSSRLNSNGIKEYWFRAWEGQKMNWIELGLLNESSTDFSKYRGDIGLYRARLNDEIVYLGKATELNNGGFRKRLRDYTRKSPSARSYTAGQLMYCHRNDLKIEIRIFERSLESIPKIEVCEKKLIKQYEPEWNK